MRLDDRAFQAQLSSLADRDIKIAATWALNDTARDVLKHVQDRMRTAFDRPTRFTLNAFAITKGAKPSSLEAVVEERPSVGKRHYLKVEESGGPRGMTGTEKLIALHAPTDMAIQAVLPADEARLDAYGNWSSGERNQVLSSIRAQRDPLSNTTIASKKRKPKRATYFVPQHGLTPGIYRRDASGDIGIVAVFASKVPTYSPLLGFYDGAERTFEVRLPEHLTRTIAKMVAKRAAGPSGA